jgi:hypothetical protein
MPIYRWDRRSRRLAEGSQHLEKPRRGALKMAKIPSVASATNGRNGSTSEPTQQQQLLLDAYFANPNAAAVAREHRKSERNVRRIVETFADLLHERRRQQDAERRARADARRAKIDDWADRGLDETLQHLDALMTTETEGVAIRAIKLKLDIAMRGVDPPAVFSADSGIDAMRLAKERELVLQLRAIDADEATGMNGAGR